MVSPFSLSAPVFCFSLLKWIFIWMSLPLPLLIVSGGAIQVREREVFHSHLHAHCTGKSAPYILLHTRWFLNWSTKKKQKSDFGSSDVKLFFTIAKFEVMLCTTYTRRTLRSLLVATEIPGMQSHDVCSVVFTEKEERIKYSTCVQKWKKSSTKREVVNEDGGTTPILLKEWVKLQWSRCYRSSYIECM